ncbi:hypothetical protein K450DRAFT_245128 [Umbelopsis ramanniana AG]|uniref:Uncharacterized protein n=1 Tax=Umbelopsis ramanniana AG TaxID=1314678 RepID=A0AAD5E8Q4_UMBRA|nr:uncharacterized protein K450DRAFT_245128 [Umbelopsis ramanniana AG]KAI8578917.1 hypothetical protein K450DRAFT_245128 [Umbelopsis ramanniana AG]
MFLSHFFAINLLSRFSPLVLLSLSFFRHQFTLPFCSIVFFFLSSTVTLPSLSSISFFLSLTFSHPIFFLFVFCSFLFSSCIFVLFSFFLSSFCSFFFLSLLLLNHYLSSYILY